VLSSAHATGLIDDFLKAGTVLELLPAEETTDQ